MVSTATHASSIAYYAFLSLVPLLALCISLISFTGISQLDVYTFLTALVPDALSDFVNALVSDAFDRSGLAFSLSTLSLLWSASKGAKAMRVGLNAAYREREERNAVVVAVISIVAVIVMGVLLAATMWLIFGDSLLHTFARHIPSLQNHHTITAFTNIAITVVAGVFALALCYTFLPAGNRRFAAQLPGAAFALVGCGALSLGVPVVCGPVWQLHRAVWQPGHGRLAPVLDVSPVLHPHSGWVPQPSLGSASDVIATRHHRVTVGVAHKSVPRRPLGALGGSPYCTHVRRTKVPGTPDAGVPGTSPA